MSEGMEEEVINNADKSVKQQAKDRYENPLWKGGQQRMDVHVGLARPCI